jgi:hypothetical protein
MQFYKAPNDPTPHALSQADIDGGGESYLPHGFSRITDAEAEQMRLAQLPVPTAESIEDAFTAAIQKRLDDFARTRNYDGILSACTYAASAVPKFQGEGAACVNLRDATWAAAYDILAEVQGGQRSMPSNIEDIADDLPDLAWPQ